MLHHHTRAPPPPSGRDGVGCSCVSIIIFAESLIGIFAAIFFSFNQKVPIFYTHFVENRLGKVLSKSSIIVEKYIKR